jgi:hypothetical protein
MRENDSPTLRSSAVMPWSRDDHGWRVWGLPVDPQWWGRDLAKKPQRKKEMQALAEYRYAMQGGPGCLAAMVASASEHLTAWEKAGIPIAGRRWADIGGGSGHYALALRLAAATDVTLLDESAPGPWSLPVLWAAGIEVVVGDATFTEIPGADAALLLYVPGVGAQRVLRLNPDLRLLITNDLSPFDREIIIEGGWKISSVPFPRGLLGMGDGSAVPGYEHTRDEDKLWVAHGESRLVLPDFEDVDEYSGEIGDEDIPF